MYRNEISGLRISLIKQTGAFTETGNSPVLEQYEKRFNNSDFKYHYKVEHWLHTIWVVIIEDTNKTTRKIIELHHNIESANHKLLQLR